MIRGNLTVDRTPIDDRGFERAEGSIVFLWDRSWFSAVLLDDDSPSEDKGRTIVETRSAKAYDFGGEIGTYGHDRGRFTDPVEVGVEGFGTSVKATANCKRSRYSDAFEHGDLKGALNVADKISGRCIGGTNHGYYEDAVRRRHGDVLELPKRQSIRGAIGTRDNVIDDERQEVYTARVLGWGNRKVTVWLPKGIKDEDALFFIIDKALGYDWTGANDFTSPAPEPRS